MFGLTNTWQIKIAEYLIVVTVVLGMGWFVYHKGYEAADNKWTVLQAQSNIEAQKKYNLVATQLETVKAERIIKTQYVTKTVTKLVDRPIYKNVCVDQDGMDIINKALSGANNDQPAK